MINELRKRLESYSLKIDDEKIELLRKFYLFLKETNEKINLMARRNFDRTFLSLVFQSIWAGSKIMRFNSLIDVGSGAGFPGIPIKIYWQSIKVYLIEPKKKKVNF